MNPSFYLIVLLSCGLAAAEGDQTLNDPTLTKQQIDDRNAAWKLSLDKKMDGFFKLMKRAQTLEKPVEKLTTSRAAFSVTNPTPTTAGDDDVTVKYKKVSTNIGTYYDADRGSFLVDIPGLYYFTFFFHTMSKKSGALELQVNGRRKVKSIEQIAWADYGDSAGNAMILDLAMGDRVKVVMKEDMCIKDEDYVNTFTGFLLQPSLASDSLEVRQVPRELLEELHQVAAAAGSSGLRSLLRPPPCPSDEEVVPRLILRAPDDN